MYGPVAHSGFHFGGAEFYPLNYPPPPPQRLKASEERYINTPYETDDARHVDTLSRSVCQVLDANDAILRALRDGDLLAKCSFFLCGGGGGGALRVRNIVMAPLISSVEAHEIQRDA